MKVLLSEYLERQQIVNSRNRGFTQAQLQYDIPDTAMVVEQSECVAK